MSTHSRSAKIRQDLNHPVIDSDGHTVGFSHIYRDYLRQVRGTKNADRYRHRLRELTRLRHGHLYRNYSGHT